MPPLPQGTAVSWLTADGVIHGIVAEDEQPGEPVHVEHDGGSVRLARRFLRVQSDEITHGRLPDGVERVPTVRWAGILIPADLAERLDEARGGVGKSAVIREALAAWVDGAPAGVLHSPRSGRL